jgi:hypothetical protein
MSGSPITPVGRRRQPLSVAAAVAGVGIVAALAGYGIGQVTSDDLGDARAEGAKAGQHEGATVGTRRGYAAGLAAGRRRGYDQTYRRTLDAQLKKAGLAP